MIDLRFDPFLFEFRPKNLTGEIKTVRHFPAFNRVGFFLNETPQRLTSRPVSIICAGDTLSEVGRLTAPGADDFRIDYGNVANFAQTGFVEINAARVGQVAVINYRGLGVNLNASLRDDAMPNLQRSVIANQNATVQGLTVTGSLDFSTILSAGMQRLRDLTTVSASDIINLATFTGLTSRSAPQMLTSSGFWEKPANVRKVFFILVGPGGSGHIDGGGGGGGASVYGVADLDAIGGNMFAYVVGVVGIATTMFGCVAGAGSSASSSTGASGGTGSVGSGVVGVASTAGNGSNGYYAAIAFDGTHRVMTSPDGVTWAARAVTANPWVGIAYGNGKLVAVAGSGANRIMTSSDGVTWTAIAEPETNPWNSVTYGAGLFVSVAVSGTNQVMTSPDGISWTPRLASEASQWRSVAYGDGVFVAIAQFGTNLVMTSPDGITWTSRVQASSDAWLTVAYGNGLFVAVTENAVMTSPDGITWTSRTPASANNWRGITYGNGVWVAVAYGGPDSDLVMTSPDGVTWTSRTAAHSAAWNSVTYGAGLFVAVAINNVDSVMTSPDGITWTTRTGAESYNSWNAVHYIPAGAGGGSGGGLGGNGNDADCGKPGKRKGFFSGSGGDATNPPESFGGGAGAGGTGADGLILLVY